MAPRKLPKDALLTEILQKVSSAKTKKGSLLIINFDDSLEFLLPEGEVPYTPNDAPAGTEHTRLTQEYRGLYRFFKGGDASIKGMRREQLFVQLLEGLHADEANLLVSACNNDIQSKYRITKAVVAEAFPQIEWGNRG